MSGRRRSTSVRLGGDPITIAWSPDELSEISEAASRRGISSSGLIRAIIEAASPHGMEEAAAECHMPRASWIRVIVLESLGISRVSAQVKLAAHSMAREIE